MTPDRCPDRVDATRGAPADGSLARLAGLLWEERELLRRLQFNLATHQLIVGSGDWEWVAFADDEVRATSERLQQVEILRCAEAESLACDLGLGPDATLRELAESAPEPWPSILADHDAALRALTLAVDGSAARTEHLINTTVVPGPGGHGDGSSADEAAASLGDVGSA